MYKKLRKKILIPFVFALLVMNSFPQKAEAALADSYVKSKIEKFSTKTTTQYKMTGYVYLQSYDYDSNPATYYESGSGKWTDKTPIQIGSSLYNPDVNDEGNKDMGVASHWGFVVGKTEWAPGSKRRFVNNTDPYNKRVEYDRLINTFYTRNKTAPQTKGVVSITGHQHSSGNDYWVKPSTLIEIRTRGYQQYPGTKHQWDDFVKDNYIQFTGEGIDVRAMIDYKGTYKGTKTHAHIETGKVTYNRADGNRDLYTTFKARPTQKSGSYNISTYSGSNNGKTVGYTDTGKNLKIDGTNPSGSLSVNSRGLDNANALTKFSPSDGQSGVEKWRYRKEINGTWGAWSSYYTRAENITISDNGKVKLQMHVIDNVGNTGTVNSGFFEVDKQAPSGTITGNPTAWTNNNVTLTINATDTGIAGVNRIKKPDGTWVTGSTTTYSVSSNGNYSFVVEDKAGNTQTVSANVTKIDKAAPGGSITGNPTAWTNGNAVLKLTTSDTGGSGYYRTKMPDGTFSTSATPTYTATANGTYTFTVYDNAGNSKTVSEVVTKLDNATPSGTVTGNPTAWTNANVTLTMNATDTGGSGIKQVKDHAGNITAGSKATYVVTANGTYNFTVYDNAGNSKVVSTAVTKIDKAAPNGTVSGNPTGWTKGNAVLKLTASDTGGSAYYRTKLPDGTFSTSATPTYTATANGTYTFTVYDNAGNSKAVSAAVTKIDKTVPALTVTKSTSSWTNADVTLNATATDTQSGLNYITLPNGTKDTSSPASQVVSANGTYTFKAIDNAGNEATNATAVTNIDKVAPGGTVTGNPTAWTNANVTLTMNATDTGGSGVKQVKDHSGKITAGSKATYVVTANGTYNFTVYDNAGNSKVISTAVNKIDKAVPNGTVSGNPTAWTKANAVLKLTASDTGGSGYYRTKLPDGTFSTSATPTYTATANGTYTFTVYDNAGNSKAVSAAVTKIDKTVPALTVTKSTSSWTNADVTLNAAATDTQSGLNYITLPNGTKDYSSPASQVVSANGTYTFKAIDNAGNEATNATAVTNIDKAAPSGTVTGNPTAWTNANVTLTMNATDTGGSGIKQVKDHAGNITTGSKATYVVTANGTYNFTVYDNAGNSKVISTAVTKIDKGVPNGTISGNPTSWTNGNAVLKLTASDTGGSGYYRTKLPDGTFSTSAKPTYTATANGTYTFTVYDNAGNSKAVSAAVTKIDKTGPAGTITGNPTSWTNGNATLTLSASDTGGSNYYRTLLPNGTYTTSANPTYTVAANGTYTFTVYDNAGNAKVVSAVVTKIDKTAPSGSFSGNPTTWTNKDVTLKLTTSDSGGSGYYRTKLPNGTYVTSTAPTYTVSNNGTYTFTVYDIAGNAKDVSATVTKIDKILPTLGKTEIKNVTQDSFDVYVYGIADTGGSQINRVQFPTWTAANGQDDLLSDWTTNSKATGVNLGNGTWSFTVQRSEHNWEFGDYTVHVYAYDNAGNRYSVGTSHLLRDQVKPTIEVSGNPTTWGNKDITLTVKGFDTHTGVKSITLPDGTIITKNGSKGQTVSHTYRITQNGSYTFKVTDMYGNVITQTVVVNKIDKTNPTLSLSNNPTNWTNKDVTLVVSGQDSASGVSRIILPNGVVSKTNQASYVVKENGSYTFTVYDEAGNTAAKTEVVNRIDKVVPSQSTIEIKTK